MNQLEKISGIMQCTSDQKEALAMYKLEGETESKGVEIIGEVFQTTFFDMYFLDSIKNEKEAEFIQIKLGKMSVSEYEAKFEELSKSPYTSNTNMIRHGRHVTLREGWEQKLKKK